MIPYYFIILLQGFCIYHLFKNKNENYWFFVILFLPVIGSIIYLITRVFNTRDISTIQNEISTIINPTKKIKELENLIQVADTFQNRVNLADAYYETGNYEESIIQYEKSNEDAFSDDFYVLEKLIEVNFQLNNYDVVIQHVDKIRNQSNFKTSKSQFLYGASLDKIGEINLAEKELKHIDIRFSNYEERIYLTNFLIRINKIEEAKELIDEILMESTHMTKQNKRINNSHFMEAEKLKNEI